MTKKAHRIYIYTLTVIGLSTVVSIGFYGSGYYSISLSDRPAHQLHGILSPTGFWGLGMGFIGASMITFGVILYSLRKRVRWMANVGQIKHILELHIFLCLVGPALIVYHTAFKFGGIISVSFWCMIIVVVSGVVGRYLYLQIPMTITGREISPAELEKQIEAIRNRLLNEDQIADNFLQEIDATSKTLIESSKASFLKTFPKLIVENFRHDTHVHRLIQSLKQSHDNLSSGAVSQLLEKARLQRQLANLTLTQKMFRYWHMFHFPFALIMFVIMIAHIVTAFLFGYGWIFTN